MKTQFMMLPFLCAAGVAMADGVEREAPADRHLRQCLELETNAEIIRCSETGRKR